MRTTGVPHHINLTPDRTVLNDDGLDLSYVLIEAVDENGQVCPLANNTIRIKMKGNGIIAGLGNGNPQSMESFQSSEVSLFYGKAMLIIKGNDQPGNIEVKVSSDGLPDQHVLLEVK